MRKIKYPNGLGEIALMGKPAAWQRRLMLRPLRAGKYSLLAWPVQALELRHLQRVDLVFRDSHGPPQAALLTIPEFLRKPRGLREWAWVFVRWPIRTISARKPAIDSRREDFESVGPIGPVGSPGRAGTIPAASVLLFEASPVMEGRFSMEDDAAEVEHRIALWSCHQPYALDENERSIVNPEAPGALEWAKQKIESFQPHLIWGLGDTAYSDGTEATNFVDQAYGEADLKGRSGLADELRGAYRHMYRCHWSFPPLQRLMRNFPHLCVWDDHEIRDGWGSEAGDFAGGNPVVFATARGVAEEFILNNGPRVRRTPVNPAGGSIPDAHQAYIAGSIAAFVFDGRTSRHYGDPDGRILSEQQFQDFENFCSGLVKEKRVRHLVMGTAVPFINLKDIIEDLGSRAPKILMDRIGGIRDDIRDSWHSKGNRKGLKRLIGILRRLHMRRPSLNIINISGDIHVANAFSFQPIGFTRALYQFTSSALSNREHAPEFLSALTDVSRSTYSEALGLVTRIWETVVDPNLITLEPRNDLLRVCLKVYDLSVPEAERMQAVGKDLVFDVGSERFGARRMLFG